MPNWITFPMIISGWVFNTAMLGWEGLGYSLLGTVVGLGLLLPAYAIGGMGAGDVKLLAGVGAWVGSTVTFYAFCLSAVIGGVIAVAMVLYRRGWRKHQAQFMMILNEITTVGDPDRACHAQQNARAPCCFCPMGSRLPSGRSFTSSGRECWYELQALIVNNPFAGMLPRPGWQG